MHQLTPQDAVSCSFEFFAAITGAKLSDMYARRRGTLPDTARNLARFLLYEIIGPTQQEGWLIGISKAAKRDHATVRACALKYDWRSSPDIARLFDWLEIHWHEPLAIHREIIRKARKRFRAVLYYWRKRRGSKRLKPEDVVRAVASLGRTMPKIERTAVPVFDEPPELQILRRGPAFTEHSPILEMEPAYGGGFFVGIVHTAKDITSELLRGAVKVYDGLGWTARQNTFGPDRDGRGFKGVLHVALASLALVFCPLPAQQSTPSTQAA